MIAIPSKYAELILGLDFVILITSLLFRKPKRRTVTSTPDRRSIRRVGYYIIGSAIVGLVVAHYALFQSYLNYFAGLSLNTFMFYLGLKAVMYRE